jgi:hypothetical protein
MKIYHKYSNQQWDYNALQSNPNFILNTILIPKQHINWTFISKNSSITMEMIPKYVNNWDYNQLSNNPGIPINDIFNTIYKYPWNISILSSRSDLYFKWIFKYYNQLNFDWGGISKYNENITIELILTHQHFPWNYKYLEQNIHLFYSILNGKTYTNQYMIGLLLSRMRMSYSQMYTNDFLTNIDHVCNNFSLIYKINTVIKNMFELNINWDAISEYKYLTFDVVKKFKSKPWNKYNISKNSNISMDIVENNLDFIWDPKGLSLNPNINTNFIRKYSHIFTFDYTLLAHVLDLASLDSLLQFDQIPSSVFKNPNITLDFIEKQNLSLDSSQLKNLSVNKFKKN